MIKKHSPQAIIIIITLCVLFLFYTPSKAYARSDSNTLPIASIHKILNWEKETVHSNNSILSSTLISTAGTTEADWLALALGRLGNQMDYETYLTSLTSYIINQYENNNGVISNKATEWHRLALTMLSLGGDPTAIHCNDKTISLIQEGTYGFNASASLDQQGINGLAYALLTMDAYRYQVPKDSTYTREYLIETLVGRQNQNGGFSLDPSQKTSDPDITAIVVQALSPYYNEELIFHKKTIRQCIDTSLNYLSQAQTDDGSIKGVNGQTLESTAQVLLACTTLGIDPKNDVRFVKNKNSLLDGLLCYQLEDGGFVHQLTDKEANTLSSEQALCALISYVRYLNGDRTFFDMRPEMSNDTKDIITSLEQQLSKLTTTKKETLQQLYKTYCSIPPEERSYVYHYYKLKDAMTSKGLTTKPATINESMGINTKGNGSIYNVIAQKTLALETGFTVNDLKTYEALSVPYSVDDYGTVISLLLKLKRTNPDTYPSDCSIAISYDELLQKLEEEKAAIETMNVKITEINAKIKEQLEPFTHITKNDKELVAQLIGEVAALNKSAQEKIVDYDQLLAAHETLNRSNRTVLIWVILCISVILLAVPLVIFLSHKRKEKSS
ncbi:MAG: hypothetical protein Q4F05_05480 [bacterium]|nr:hypothetical protein [bacterium]